MSAMLGSSGGGSAIAAGASGLKVKRIQQGFVTVAHTEYNYTHKQNLPAAGIETATVSIQSVSDMSMAEIICTVSTGFTYSVIDHSIGKAAAAAAMSGDIAMGKFLSASQISVSAFVLQYGVIGWKVIEYENI